jgi:hypothetical protein
MKLVQVMPEMQSITEQFNLKVVDVVFHATATPDAFGRTPLEFHTKMEDFQSYGAILMCFLTGSAEPDQFRVRFEASDDGRSAHEYTIRGGYTYSRAQRYMCLCGRKSVICLGMRNAITTSLYLVTRIYLWRSM